MAEDIIIRYRAEVEDLKRKVDGLIDQQERLQKSVDDTDKEFKDTSKSAKSLGNELGQLGEKGEGLNDVSGSAKKANKSFISFGKTIAKIGTGIAAALSAAQFIKFAGSSIKAAQDLETLTLSFETFLGSAEKAEKVIKDLDKFSIRTPFSPQEVQEAGKALLAFGIQSEDLIETLRRIGDISAATGKNFNELAVIYGKAKTQGTLFAEDINQLTEAGIPIIEELAEQFGVAEGEVKKLGSEGKLTFENLEQGFKNLTSEGGRFFGLTDKLADSTTGKLSTLEGKVTELQRAFGRNLLPIVNGLAKAAGDIIDAFLGVEEAADDAGAEFDELNGRFQVLTGTLKNGNLTVEQRRKLINQINQEYKEYLPNLLTEKTSLEELEDAIKAVNDQLIQRAVLARAQADITDITAKIVDAQSKLYDIQIKKEELRQKAQKDTQGLAQSYQFQLEQLDQAEKVNLATIESNTEALNNLQSKYGDLIKDLQTLGQIEGGTSGVTEDDIKRVKELQKELEKLGQLRLKPQDFTTLGDRAKELSDKIVKLTEDSGQSIETSFKIVLTENGVAFDSYLAQLVNEYLEFNKIVKDSQQTAVQGSAEIATSGALALTDSLRREIDLLQEFGDSAVQIFQGISDARIRQIDLQEQRFQENIDKERETLEESREQRLITEKEYQEGIDELNQKEQESQAKLAEERAKIAKRQAVLEKTAALLTIAVEAAQAVAQIQAQAAVLLANPLTAPLAVNALAQIPFVLGSAAFQAAVIAAQPLPQFAKGTKGKKDSGMAIVGEEGPEMTFLPEGSKVLPAKQTRTYGEVFDAMYDNRFDDYVLKEFVTPALQEQKRKYEQVQSERFADNVAHSITVSNSGLYWDLENIRKKGQRVVNADDIGRAVAKEVGKVIPNRRRQ